MKSHPFAKEKADIGLFRIFCFLPGNKAFAKPQLDL